MHGYICPHCNVWPDAVVYKSYMYNVAMFTELYDQN